MRCQLPEKFQQIHDFERGDKALAVYKNEELIKIISLTSISPEDDDNNEILSLSKDGSKIYEVQFLDKKHFSKDFAMKL